MVYKTVHNIVNVQPECYTVKNVVKYLTLRSANYTFIRVISTPTVSYNTPLVWYAHFIFYSVYH